MPPRVRPRLVTLLALVALAVACQKPAERLFSVSTQGPSRAGLVGLEDGVLVGNEAGRLKRLGRDGHEVWSVELGREVAVRPTVAGDGVIAGTVGGVLVHLSLASGEERWRLGGQPPVLAPLVSDEASVYVVAPDGSVRAHALEGDGTLRWRWPTPGGKPRPEALSPLPSPVLVDGLLVAVLGEGGLVALATDKGTVRWQQPVAEVLGLESSGDTLYVSTRSGQVLALGWGDGQVRWRQQVPVTALTSPPTLAQGHLWVGAAEPPELLALSPEDGHLESRATLPSPLVTRVAALGPRLLVPTSGSQGWLLAFERPEGPAVFSLRVDTPLRTPPVLLGQQLFVLGLDGRVLSWRLKPAAESGR